MDSPTQPSPDQEAKSPQDDALAIVPATHQSSRFFTKELIRHSLLSVSVLGIILIMASILNSYAEFLGLDWVRLLKNVDNATVKVIAPSSGSLQANDARQQRVKLSSRKFGCGQMSTFGL